MNENNNSVGIVEPKTLKLDLPDGGLQLDSAQSLPEITVSYESYGKLSPNKDNAVFICHALTGDAHVAGYYSKDDEKPGWWEEMIGPGKGIDTNYYHVICANILGGCSGTTGPASTNPATGKPYGSSFPEITVADIVKTQKVFLEQLGIEKLAAVIGGSFGGMQVIQWSIQYPDAVDRCICIAAAASLSTQALAFDVVARDAIFCDPNWADGDYYDKNAKPAWGLAHARKIGHITYLSPEMLQKKFGREKVEKKDDTDRTKPAYQVESYLNYQGKKLVERFDANSYLRITHAMDSYDLRKEFGSLDKSFENVKSKFLIIGLSSDWLFTPEQSIELANALLKAGKDVSCCTLEAPYGHDAFLIEIEHLSETVRAFLPWISPEKKSSEKEKNIVKSPEYKLIRETVENGKRILDIGCGNGDLLSALAEEKKTPGFGIDINLDSVIQAIDKGNNVFQGDIDAGLEMIPDQTYDYAILSGTLQVVRKPRHALKEMLRVAKEGIVIFPNFGKWSHRSCIGFLGRMPKSRSLPFEWHNTPNIHLFTLKDFKNLCATEGIKILDITCIPDGIISKLLISLGLKNLGADRAVVRIAKKS